MEKVLRALVVDDSAYVRKVIRQMLGRSPFIDVVGAAGTAEDALSMVEQLKPDVVTLDLMMPGIGGLGFINEQMKRRPLPIVVVSMASETSRMVLDALDAGAVDFVQKPSALATDKVFEMSDELIEKVKGAAAIQPAAVRGGSFSVKRPAQPKSYGAQRSAPAIDLVAIGISTGGPYALRQLLPAFPATFPVPIAVVLHMPLGYTAAYAEKLNEACRLKVSEAQDGDTIQPGHIFIAPAGCHLKFRRNEAGILSAYTDALPFDTLHRPSADVLFQSAADVLGNRTLAVVMTGIGDDGKDGAAAVREKGGIVLAQSEESCVVYGMPRAVIEAGLAHRVVALEDMYAVIVEVADGKDPRSR